jgi:hypothetical protein
VIRGTQPAHPCVIRERRRITIEGPETLVDVIYDGLTIRERFAMAAMQGIAARAHLTSNSMVAIAGLSVQMADALITELAKVKP